MARKLPAMSRLSAASQGLKAQARRAEVGQGFVVPGAGRRAMCGYGAPTYRLEIFRRDSVCRADVGDIIRRRTGSPVEHAIRGHPEPI